MLRREPDVTRRGWRGGLLDCHYPRFARVALAELRVVPRLRQVIARAFLDQCVLGGIVAEEI